MAGDLTLDATVGLERAERLYDRVFSEYGDDSVAQLGGVHLACEQSSNVLTKVLEWGRLMAYLEQSTRYIEYDKRLDGRYRYLRPPEFRRSVAGEYVAAMDAIFDTYRDLLPPMHEWARERFPKQPGDSDLVYKQSVRAKACDALRGLLPAATLSNVGIYGTGQGYEALLLRMRSHPLPEARQYAQLMLAELRKVIPSFLRRVDRPDRGGAWSRYFEQTREETAAVVERLFGGLEPGEAAGPPVRLLDWDPERRGQGARRHRLPAQRPARAPAARRRGPPRRGRPPGPARRLRRRPHEPAPQARPGLRAHRLPLRRLLRLRRLPRPAAPPDAHDRVAVAHARARLRAPGARGRGRPGRRVPRGHGPLARASTTSCATTSRRRRSTRWRSATASAS